MSSPGSAQVACRKPGQIDRALERSCDIIATEILMPQQEFSAKAGDFGWTLRAIRTLADTFQVTVQAAVRRLMELIDEPALMSVWCPRPHQPLLRLKHSWSIPNQPGKQWRPQVLWQTGPDFIPPMYQALNEHYPYLVNHCLQRGYEIIGHGISVSQMITSDMSEQQEREYIRNSVGTLKRTTGVAPTGWLGAEYGESARTPQLLSQEGIQYVCDWTNDEQPYPLKSPHGELFALPIMMELDDVNALWDRHVAIGRYRDMLKEGFDTMYHESADNGRLLTLNLHPWLIGQPFRTRYLDDALGHMMRRKGVWAASGSEIIDWYRRNPPVA